MKEPDTNQVPNVNQDPNANQDQKASRVTETIHKETEAMKSERASGFEEKEIDSIKVEHLKEKLKKNDLDILGDAQAKKTAAERIVNKMKELDAI